mmetsp:Transcript_2739/g.7673  ORF Transcript_2739/g.7673 Transcript_2739/m.7673 type:complete len:283 (-) Transcript_2739:1242-2090(-)
MDPQKCDKGARMRRAVPTRKQASMRRAPRFTAMHVHWGGCISAGSLSLQSLVVGAEPRQQPHHDDAPDIEKLDDHPGGQPHPEHVEPSRAARDVVHRVLPGALGALPEADRVDQRRDPRALLRDHRREQEHVQHPACQQDRRHEHEQRGLPRLHDAHLDEQQRHRDRDDEEKDEEALLHRDRSLPQDGLRQIPHVRDILRSHIAEHVATERVDHDAQGPADVHNPAREAQNDAAEDGGQENVHHDPRGQRASGALAAQGVAHARREHDASPDRQEYRLVPPG